MAQWVKVLALQACQTDFIPEIHAKEERTKLSSVHPRVRARTHHTHTIIINE